MQISVTILTRNSDKYLGEILDQLQPFDEVLLLDSGSSDRTFDVAKQFPNVSLYRDAFTGFGEMHNKAAALARHDWILSIDSDEIPEPSLIEEIQRLSLDPHVVYAIPRKNFFRGKWIKGCGWYPDRVKRLYCRRMTEWTGAKVHESVKSEGLKCVALHSALRHYSYETIEDFLNKMQGYSSLFAREYAQKRSSSHCKALLHGGFAFFKSYVLQRGVFDGFEGFLISSYNGQTAFYKYLKLLELNGKEV